jgi:hypothetical protein
VTYLVDLRLCDLVEIICFERGMYVVPRDGSVI